MDTLLTTVSLYVCSETGEFWTTLKLHCAMRISGIAVVSSIAIPEKVSLSPLQFQVSHNTNAQNSRQSAVLNNICKILQLLCRMVSILCTTANSAHTGQFYEHTI